ncbi:HAD-IA family hydrolase [archaeon]|jgi:HAD superfamily hydrolase (TIGR01549 family)|nr:HAD-IA family hydrolase [archaeon]MBT4397480.1 HAD-IA family hydrolase [archaeon]MBT4440875.1 HAD-IA family hydrolase [archaeon]
MTILFAWDFHGVLEKDTEYAVVERTNLTLKEFGYDLELSLEDLRPFYGMKWGDYYKHFIPGISEEKVREMVDWAVKTSQESINKFIKPNDHAAEVLDTLNKKGNTNILISNTNPEAIFWFTDSVKLTDFFEKIIGLDKHLEKETKSKSEAILEFKEQKNFEKIVVIGDHEKDIEEGIKVGAITYLFTKKDPSTIQTKADHIITDLREVFNE